MARSTVLRESRSYVIGVGRAFEIINMAAITIGWRSGEPVADVALDAGCGGVRARQSEARELIVVEPRILPYRHLVARLTGGRQIGRDVIQRRPGLIVLEVARDALGAEPDVDTDGGTFVAVVASSYCVGAKQREPVVVIADGGDLYTPAFHGMAVLTIRSELAAMQIGMALRAAGRRFRKLQIHVAARTRYILVQP